MSEFVVLIKGAGDLASGVAATLFRHGLQVVMTELPQPLMVRRAVSFGQAVYSGQVQVEEISGRRVADSDAARRIAAAGVIPVLIDPRAACRADLRPAVVVDAIVAKTNTGTRLDDAPLVIALGPGFSAGLDCHAVIETNRGPDLGRVIWHGPAEADSGVPGDVGGMRGERVLRAPCAGRFAARAAIGDGVALGQVVATVDGEPVVARCAGVLRGLLYNGLTVPAGLKVGDVDPRGDRRACFSISDKALVVGEGVLQALRAAGLR